jgi:glycosyltransferase involved in cell wall biosynthesis
MVTDWGLRNVRFVGTVPQDEVPALYAAADIYLTSPNIDNMPGSLLECYASGLPVVATNVGGIPYIARNEETALLVDSNDHEGMARAALRLIAEDGLAQRLTNAARQQCRLYTGTVVRSEWLALYDQLHSTQA